MPILSSTKQITPKRSNTPASGQLPMGKAIKGEPPMSNAKRMGNSASRAKKSASMIKGALA